MFKVKSRLTDEIFLVYAVELDEYDISRFLVYEMRGQWDWVNAYDFVPVENKEK